MLGGIRETHVCNLEKDQDNWVNQADEQPMKDMLARHALALDEERWWESGSQEDWDTPLQGKWKRKEPFRQQGKPNSALLSSEWL